MICHLVWNVNGWVIHVEVFVESVQVELFPLVFELLEGVPVFILRVLLFTILLSFLIFGSLVLLSYIKNHNSHNISYKIGFI